MQTAAKSLKRILLSVSALFLSSFFFHGFSQARITGSVLDTRQQPLANASILLLKSEDSALVKGSFSSKTGQYSFSDIKPGSYLVSATHTGFKPAYSSPMKVENSEIQVAALSIAESAVELAEVSVTVKKPLFEQKIDRMVVNVASSITSAGSTALEVLQRSPGVVVDYQNSNISMNGKEGVVVMINGKINHMATSSLVQLLQSMPSSNIEKIELITTPPANFDAEGNAGYINIVLKQNTQYGTNGSYSLTAGYGKGPVTSASINLNHRKGKLNLYGDLSLSRNVLKQNFLFYRKVVNQGKPVESYVGSDRDPVITDYQARLGMDYELSKKTILGLLAFGYDNKWSMDALNNTNIFVNNALDTILSNYTHELHQLNNYGTNLNLQHNYSADEKLTLNFDYIYYYDNNPVRYLNKYANGSGTLISEQQTRSSKKTPIKFWTFTADYTKKISKKIELEAGVKETISRFNNNVAVESLVQNSWTKDPELTAEYALKETISAAYTSFNVGISEATNMKLGLRYEYTNSNLGSALQKDIVDRQYGKLFPSFFISHSFNEKNSLNFSYSRRITRPTFNDMAPFVIFLDPSTFFSGNPALQPSVSDAFKTDYLFKKFVFSFSYTFENDPITNFSPKVDPVTNKQTLAAENQKNQQTLNLSVSLPLTISRWWNSQTNMNGNWQQLDAFYLGDPLKIRQASFNINTTQSFTLPKNFSIELSAFYQSGGLFGVYKISPIATADFGIQKKLASKNSNVRFAVSNLLGAPVFKAVVNAPAQNLIVRDQLNFTNTTFKLTFTRNFGNDKVKQKRDRSTGSEEEQQRVQTN